MIKKMEEKLFKSFGLIFVFYIILFYVFFVVCLWNKDLLLVLSTIFLGNLGIAVITQLGHYILDSKDDDENSKNDFLFDSTRDCFVRCAAGVSEMIFYTIFFATAHYELVVGYLVVKTVSTWKADSSKSIPRDQKKEGQHTAVLRIAIVLSLIISLIASYFLSPLIKNFNL